MAGFDVSRTIYSLRFDDPRFEGFEVQVEAMSVRETWEYNDAVAEAADDAQVIRLMIETIGKHLVSWNATKNGEPVPATGEQFAELDGHYTSAVIDGWLQAIRPPKQDAPDPTRPAGASLEESLPMQTSPVINGSVPAPAG